jgi:hypothetical protein
MLVIARESGRVETGGKSRLVDGFGAVLPVRFWIVMCGDEWESGIGDRKDDEPLLCTF